MKPIAAKTAKSAPTIAPAGISHKLGLNQKETAVKTVKLDANFKQSRDVREDRSQRQAKNAPPVPFKKGK